jgi:hypothetical protein
MNATTREQLRLAHDELVAAQEDWTREFREVRSTQRYEDLALVARQLDEAIKRLLRASEMVLQTE